MIPAGSSLAEAIRFYRDELGFAVTWQGGDMAGIERGGVGFNLVVNTSREWAQNASFSIAVDGLDALYREYGASSARVGPLEEKPWGRREFHMIVAPGVCLQFYEAGN
jgi:catechol 2,3-dioxygenase-like lactoylglutathione lyase family enzyme